MAMGDAYRGLLPDDVSCRTWEVFVQALKPKFLLHTAEWSLFLELKQWQAERDWPRFHAKVQAYRLFLDKALEPAIKIFIVAAFPDYLARKVVKPPLPVTLDEAIDRTWQAFHTCPPIGSAQTPAATSAAPVTSSTQHMELDTLKAMPSAIPTHYFPLGSQFNVFTGKPMMQTFGRSR